ncbi:MAG: hypothetical protein FWG62_03560, partial [Proteobacteria bacterium]|nr:hypothetical protein [Pseudomonadota bacterium]
PNPLESLNHFTVPSAISVPPCVNELTLTWVAGHLWMRVYTPDSRKRQEERPARYLDGMTPKKNHIVSWPASVFIHIPTTLPVARLPEIVATGCGVGRKRRLLGGMGCK